MVQCVGCHQTLKNGKAYSNHQRACKKYKAAGALHLRQMQLNKAKKVEGAQALQLHEEFTPVSLRPSGRPNRHAQLPTCFRGGASPPRRQRRPSTYQDNLPAEPPPLISQVLSESTSNEKPSAQAPILDDMDPASNTFQTLPDKFGVYQVYPNGRPSYTPDELYTISDSVGSSNISTNEPSALKSQLWFPPFGSSLTGVVAQSAPFANMSTLHLMSWFYSTSNTKSHAELDRLVNEVILTPDFSPAELVGLILMTCLKYMAQCPCLHCLILKSNIPRLGMEVDKKARQKLAQVNSKEIQNTVNHARRLMFEDGINISSVVIDRLLKPLSLVPTCKGDCRFGSG
jgi:hypothetical protein